MKSDPIPATVCMGQETHATLFPLTRAFLFTGREAADRVEAGMEEKQADFWSLKPGSQETIRAGILPKSGPSTASHAASSLTLCALCVPDRSPHGDLPLAHARRHS